jgi:VWFA-related protein
MWRDPFKVAAGAASLLLIGGGTLSGSPAQDRPPRFQSGVEIVTVDVTVVDADGQPVLGLRPADFNVTVDGVRQRVATADWIAVAPMAPLTAASAVATRAPEPYTSNDSAGSGRLIVLLIDRLNIRFEGLLAHRETIAKFIEDLRPSDRVAVIAAGVDSSSSVTFTTDHERAKSALLRVVGQRGLAGTDAVLALRDLLIALKPIDAPKTIVLISEGFAPPTEAVRDDRRPYLVEIEHLAAEARTIVYALQLAPRMGDIRQSRQDSALGPDLTEPPAQQRRGGAASQGAAPAAFDDPRTMPGPANATTPDRVEAGGGLFSVAAVTGGAMFTAVMTADHALERISSEISGYYLLGVEADPAHRDGRPHRIEVKVPRDGVTVRSRRQLIVTPTAPPATPEEALLPAFGSPVPKTALPLRVSTYTTRGSDSGQVQVLIHAEAGDRYVAAKTIVLGYLVLDRNGEVVRRRAGNSTLRPAHSNSPTPLQVTTSLTLDPGDYTLKLAVADGNRVGSVEHPIRASLEGDGATTFSDLIVGGTVGAKPATPPPVGSTIRHDYAQGFLEVYGAGLAALAARLDIATTPGGAALASAPVDTVAAGGGRTILTGVLPVRDLAPGRYVFRIVVAIPGKPARTIVRTFEKL